MTESNTIKIIGVDDADTVERIHSQLRTLILAVEGTIPGSRGFGLAHDFQDMAMTPDMVNQLAIELEEKCETYIPEISISSVVNEPEFGQSALKIYVERRAS